MSQWLTLLQKEFLEMTRNYKWIWVPLTFVLLGVMDPLTSFYMPQILDMAGGMPEGAIIKIPVPSAEEVLILSLGEYQTLGLLILVLSIMGIVGGERKSGVAQLILVKPVSYISFITAKWTGALILFLGSLFLGLFASWYYTGMLFSFIPMHHVATAYFLYGLWLALTLSIVVFYSSLFKHPGAAAAAALTTTFLLTIIGGTLPHLLQWSPSQLYPYASEMIMTGNLPQHTWGTITVTLIIIISLIVASIMILKQKELAD